MGSEFDQWYVDFAAIDSYEIRYAADAWWRLKKGGLSFACDNSQQREFGRPTCLFKKVI